MFILLGVLAQDLYISMKSSLRHLKKIIDCHYILQQLQAHKFATEKNKTEVTTLSEYESLWHTRVTPSRTNYALTKKK